MDALTEAIEAHREMHLKRVHRDRALSRAVQEGMTAYAVAKALRDALGEDAGLTAEGVRRIVKRKP